MTIAGSGPTSPEGGGDVPDQVQLLTPDGERVDHPEYRCDADDATIAGWLRDMIITRRIDTEATALQRQGELGLWASCLGQEAAQIGSGRALRAHDVAFPSYREHGVAWCRGVAPVQLLSMFRGSDLGDWDPYRHNFFLYSIIIGSQTLHATGYALGLETDGAVGNDDPDRDTAVITYFGDGATSQGDTNESFVFAASYNAPVVFFCQNNQWAISEPSARQSRIPLYRRASGFGFPGVRVDGNDVLAVRAVTEAALDRARSGNGPTLIEAFTYRMGAHTTSDDPSKYRLAAELDQWRAKDPIERVVTYLRGTGAIDDDWLAAVDAGADVLATDLRRDCLALPDPDPAVGFDHVYREQTPYLAEQQAAYVAYAESFVTEPGGR